jgi:hypothetical protein
MSDIVRVESAPMGTQGGAFASAGSFELAQRMAKCLAASDLVPPQYRNNVSNTMLALEIAQRIGASPLMVMQNLNIIHGKPSWSSQFIIAAINSCGRFGPLRFRVEGEGEGRVVTAYAPEKGTGEILEGPPVSIAMAKSEGWLAKSGSKWVTMPDLMLRYRAAAFFGRLYAPDVLMGVYTADEIVEIDAAEVPVQRAIPTASVEELNQVIVEESNDTDPF